MHGLVRVAALAVSLVLGVFGALGPSSSVVAQQPLPPLPQSVAELVRIREDVYAFRYLNHVALFVPTDEGVVLVDPIGGGGNPKAPLALKAAIASVTDQPVRWLVYSHSAPDHGTGGAVFADTATIISQARAKEKFEARNDPTSPPPTVTFDKTMELHAGGKHFELAATDLSAQDDYLVFWYPAQKVLMTVDMVRVRALPFGELNATSPERWAEFIDRLDQTYDFEVFLSGHGPQANIHGTRQEFRDHRQYLLDLAAAVAEARAAGLADGSEEQVAKVREALAPKYGTWANFQNGLAGNVRGAVRWATGM